MILVASGTQNECRTTENIPWNDLESPEGRECYLINHCAFSSFSSFYPTTMTRDMLYEIGVTLVSHGSPLFKLADPEGSPTLPVLPSPPPSPAPSSSEELDDIMINQEPEVPHGHEQLMETIPPPAITNKIAFTFNPPTPTTATNSIPVPPVPALTTPECAPPSAAALAALELQGPIRDVTLDNVQNVPGKDNVPTAIGAAEDTELDCGSGSAAVSGSVVGKAGVSGRRKKSAQTMPPTSSRTLHPRSTVDQQPLTKAKRGATYVTSISTHIYL